MELAPVVSEAAGGWRDGCTDGCVRRSENRSGLVWHAAEGRAEELWPARFATLPVLIYTLAHTVLSQSGRQTDRRTQTDVGWGRDGGGRGKREGKREVGWVRGTERVLKATGDVRRHKSFTGYIRFNWYKKILKAARSTSRESVNTHPRRAKHTPENKAVHLFFCSYVW